MLKLKCYLEKNKIVYIHNLNYVKIAQKNAWKEINQMVTVIAPG